IGLGLDHDSDGDIKRLLFAVDYINERFPGSDKLMVLMGDQVMWHSHGRTPCPQKEIDGIKRAQLAWKGQVLAIPGNHDVWDPASRGFFLTSYSLPRSYRSEDVGPKTTFILLDTTSIDQKYKPSGFEAWDEEEEHGRVELDWFQEELERCTREGREAIVVGHYP
ncbi:hypothetical protein HDU93_006798, partial [Gonapodya sp. JEL0774]